MYELNERDLIFGRMTELDAPDADSALPHPLYVGISKLDAAKLKRTGDFIGMITRLPHMKGKRELFVNMSVINIENETDENSITLCVTKTFLEHYGFKCDVIVLFKTVYAMPLDKVVIGISSAELYEYMRDQKWATDLLLSICKNKMLVRAKDVWLAWLGLFNVGKETFFNRVTLDCYPVTQGILDVKTSIIIAKTGYQDNVSSTCLQIAKQTSSIDIKRTCNLFFYTFPYVAPKILPKYKSLIPSNCKIEIIPHLSSKIKGVITIGGEIFDSSDAIFLSKVFMSSRKLLGGNWVKIKLLQSMNNKKLNSSDCLALPDDIVNYTENTSNFFNEGCRFARVFSVEEWFCEERENIVKSNVAFISPLLWFNLNPHPSHLLQPAAELLIESLPSGFKLPYASEVYISMVQSPKINTTVDCNTLRKHYFKIPRVVCSGDVLAISSHVDILFHEKIEDAPNVGWPVVYFKVSSVISQDSSACFLVDNNNCSIYQVGTHQSYVPVTMSAYYSPFPIHPFWEVPRPAGIDHYVEHLQSIVSPYLKLKNTWHQLNPHILLMGDPGCGKSTVVKALGRSLNMHLYLVNCFDLVGGIPGSSEARMKTVFERATMYAPCILLLRNIEAIAKMKDDEDPRILNIFIENLKKVSENSDEWPVIVIATGVKSQLQNSELLSIMLHHVYMKVPSETERKSILKALFSTSSLANDVCLSYIAQRTAGFLLGDLTALLCKTLMTAYNRLKQRTTELALTWKEEVDISYAGIIVLQKDILNALEDLQTIHAQSIGAPMIPNVNWEDVGGLADVKQEILDTIQLPLQHPELLSAGLRRSGVLLYGPPGTGKTLLAKAVATECCLNFLSVKGPELINMYVGQSEENVREVFHRARSVSPCVIFFDELDSLAPNRGRSGDSGGVMDRVVSQLLAELDGLGKSAEVFVIGATNRPDLLDPALLRPGRFDRLVYVGISEDTSSRIKILQALSRKIPLAKDVSVDEIEKKCPMNLSGADFYSLCCNALMNAVGRCVQRLENGEPEKEVQLAVSQEDFDVALVTLVPSVSSEELQRFVEIKRSLTS